MPRRRTPATWSLRQFGPTRSPYRCKASRRKSSKLQHSAPLTLHLWSDLPPTIFGVRSFRCVSTSWGWARFLSRNHCRRALRSARQATTMPSSPPAIGPKTSLSRIAHR
eukprot:14319569-Alexandrium_andersonii.AAC.1